MITTTMMTMRNAPAAKDNANPIVRVVDPTNQTAHRRRRRKQYLGWSELARISADIDDNDDNNDDMMTWQDDNEDDDEYNGTTATYGNNISRQKSPEERAILQALMDTAAATDGRGVSLLRHVGVVLPEQSPPEQSHQQQQHYLAPSFFRPQRPQEKKKTTTTSTAQTKTKTTMLPQQPAQQRDVLTVDEIYDIIRNIQDPEHPLTLEQLGVVTREQIQVHDVLDDDDDSNNNDNNNDPSMKSSSSLSTLTVRFTPTVPHCSMATLIGLSIRVKLLRSLPARFKVRVEIEPGTHNSETSVNKQLADKERVCAALENPHLLQVVSKCIANGMTGNMQ